MTSSDKALLGNLCKRLEREGGGGREGERKGGRERERDKRVRESEKRGDGEKEGGRERGGDGGREADAYIIISFSSTPPSFLPSLHSSLPPSL